MARKRWSEGQIISSIRKRERAGLPISSGLVCRQDNGLYSIARYYFGSWPRALEAAGIPLPSRVKWTRSRLLSVLSTLSERGKDEYFGSAYIASESKKLRVDLRRHIRRHFGSVRELQKELGVPNRGTWLKEQAKNQVVRELKAYAGRGRLRYGELRRTNPSLFWACDRAFGGWRKALNAVQFPMESRPLNRGPLKYTPELILKILAKAWERRDVRVNTLRRQHCGIYKATIREFGSWKDGLGAAGVPSWVYATRMSAHKAVLDLSSER